MRWNRLLPLLLLYAGTALAADAAAEARGLARRVDQRYNALRTLKMDFEEKLSSAGVERRETGVLLLKKPGRMRWDYRQPKEKLFLSDGKTAYFYVPGERQARKAPVKKLDDVQSPLRYLLGRSRIEKELDDIRLEGNVLSGAPKHLRDRVERVALTISPQRLIERIVIEEVDGTRTEFVFSNIQENMAITDQQFKFKPPAGTEVIETTQMQP